VVSWRYTICGGAPPEVTSRDDEQHPVPLRVQIPTARTPMAISPGSRCAKAIPAAPWCRWAADAESLDVSALLEHQDVVDRLALGVGPLVCDGHDLPIARDRSRASDDHRSGLLQSELGVEGVDLFQ
jgi:hypothetical protein